MSDESVITPYCAEMSRLAEASPAGTATEASWWVLLEVNQPWSADVVKENKLPPAVQAWLTSVGEAGGRVLFIRQFGRIDAFLRCYVAVAAENDQRLYRFDLAGYADLLRLDLAALRRGAAYAEQLSAERLTLVCTNGKRDRCCARFGADLYRNWLPTAGDTLWQSSHQGGHRYAAVALWLPEGAQYGYLRPEDGATLQTAREQGALWLERLRGRTYYPPVAQAAEAHLRQAWELRGLSALRLLETAEPTAGTWRVRFQTTDGRVVVIDLRQETGSAELVGCSPAKYKPTVTFSVQAVTSVGAPNG